MVARRLAGLGPADGPAAAPRRSAGLRRSCAAARTSGIMTVRRMADLADNVLNKLAEIERQEEYREESWHVRELRPVAGTTIDDVNLEALNDYVQQLNRPVRVETIKPDLEAARGFLES